MEMIVDDKIEVVRDQLNNLENELEEGSLLRSRGITVEMIYELKEVMYLIEAEMELTGELGKIK